MHHTYPLGKMMLVFEIMAWILWVISSPIFTCMCLLKDYRSKTEKRLQKGLTKSIHLEETIFKLDFFEYCEFDRCIFSLAVIQFGMTLFLVIYVEATRNTS